MLRTAFLALLLACAPALAQEDYSGTYTTTHPTAGTKIVLELEQQDKRLSGTLTGSGSTFDVAAEVHPDGVAVGEITSDNAMVYLVARREGAMLLVELFEPDQSGAPDAQSMRQMRMARE